MVTMYSKNLSERLLKAREMSKFTQTEVSKETGLNRNNISRYETGDREPDVETIGVLAEFYGVSIDWLFGLGTQGTRPNYDHI